MSTLESRRAERLSTWSLLQFFSSFPFLPFSPSFFLKKLKDLFSFSLSHDLKLPKQGSRTRPDSGLGYQEKLCRRRPSSIKVTELIANCKRRRAREMQVSPYADHATTRLEFFKQPSLKEQGPIERKVYSFIPNSCPMCRFKLPMATNDAP